MEPKGGGTTNFTDVTAYAQFHPDGLYLIMGHRMSTILSYTTHTTQFDVINSRKIGAQQFTKGAYVSDQLLTEHKLRIHLFYGIFRVGQLFHPKFTTTLHLKLKLVISWRHLPYKTA